MAENKTGPNIGAGAGFFAKRVQKSLSRAQEKVMQKLGKNMETKDEQFELYSQNLIKQQNDGSRLFKEVKAYYNAVKAMHETSKRLSQTLKDVYEPDWQGGEDLSVIVESEDLLWNDYEEKLSDQIVRTMENYTGQFQEVKERVAKRGRKLVDYDSSRHHLEALQSAKKKDDVKITKAEEEFNKAQSVFEEINNEMREELPVLYQSRIGCYVTVFQNISNLRDVFYKEMSVLNHELYNVMKKLETQHSGKAFIIKGLNSKSKKRKSLAISAPIPCNTAFPSDHTALYPAAAPEGGAETVPSGNETSRQSVSEEPAAAAGETDVGAGTANPSNLTSETSDFSDELSSNGTPTSKRRSACDSDNGVGSDAPSEDQSDPQQGGALEPTSQLKDSSAVEGHTQESAVAGSDDVAPPDVSAGVSPPDVSAGVAPCDTEQPSEPQEDAKAKAPPCPAPRRSLSSVGASLGENSEEGGGGATTGDVKNTENVSGPQNAPGFLYKGVELEGHVSEDGTLQYDVEDVILILADDGDKEKCPVNREEKASMKQGDLNLALE